MMVATGLLLLAGCQAAPPATPITTETHAVAGDQAGAAAMLTLPTLAAAPRQAGPLRVVATTSIIGDVVGRVGGDAIELTTLMGPGQDPHSYQPAARDLTAVSQADVIFVNGWGLEEGLLDDLAAIGDGVPLVPVSANIAPLPWHGAEAQGDDDHDHPAADPHTWFSVHNVAQWVENIEQVFRELDPDRAAAFASNAAAYRAELEDLAQYAETQFATIPQDRRFLVTNHDSLAYLAHDYGLQVLGAVIPGASTLAEPSANDLVGLITQMNAHGVCTIFSETTVSDELARTVAAELDDCGQVQVLSLYTGAIGPAGSSADSYVGMFRTNVDRIVIGLQQSTP